MKNTDYSNADIFNFSFDFVDLGTQS